MKRRIVYIALAILTLTGAILAKHPKPVDIDCSLPNTAAFTPPLPALKSLPDFTAKPKPSAKRIELHCPLLMDVPHQALNLPVGFIAAEPNPNDNFGDSSVPTPPPKLTPMHPPEFFKVFVAVDCENENTKKLIQSHIERELRRLGDVEITPISSAYVLTIVAVEPEYKATRRETGQIVLAYMFMRLFDYKTVAPYFKHPDEKNWGDFLAKTDIQRLVHPPTIGVKTDNTAATDELCRRIVSTFDIKMLEKARVSEAEADADKKD